jgi:hypothetical protein
MSTPVIPDPDPTVLAFLEFVAPTLYNGGQPVPPLTETDIDNAAYLAASWNPECLQPQQQAEAQALYMAHVLQLRLNVINGAGAGGANPGTLSSEKEGDLQRVYALSQSAQSGAGGTGFYDRWNALWMLCRPSKRGAILTGTGRLTPPVIDWVNNPQLWQWGRWPFV